ncbi:MAG: hypothetical protein V2G42_07695 [bacterium JZ-2024 1]
MRVKALFGSVVSVFVATVATVARAEGTGGVLPEVRSHLLPEGTYEGQVQLRVFSDGSPVVGAAWATGIGKWELGLSGTRFEVENEGTIAGSIRKSRMNSIAIAVRAPIGQLSPNTPWWVEPGIEFNSWRGLVKESGVATRDNTPSFTLAVRTGRENAEGFSWVVEPKMVTWKSRVPDDAGAPVRSFGTVIGIRAAGAVQLDPRWSLSAQVIPILRGHNSFDKVTGELERQVIFEAGLIYAPGQDWWAKMGVANNGGPTPASSMLFAPDNSAGFYLAIGSSY